MCSARTLADLFHFLAAFRPRLHRFSLSPPLSPGDAVRNARPLRHELRGNLGFGRENPVNIRKFAGHRAVGAYRRRSLVLDVIRTDAARRIRGRGRRARSSRQPCDYRSGFSDRRRRIVDQGPTNERGRPADFPWKSEPGCPCRRFSRGCRWTFTSHSFVTIEKTATEVRSSPTTEEHVALHNRPLQHQENKRWKERAAPKVKRSAGTRKNYEIRRRVWSRKNLANARLCNHVRG